MTEAKLQSLMVVEFSQQRPNEKGLLWSTRNITLSERDGQKQKAMGMVAGVSDLIYFKNAHFVGIEAKLPNAKHSRNHIEKQYEWGCKIESEGGRYYITTSLYGFWSIITGFLPILEVYDTERIKILLDTNKSTIIF